MNGVNGIGVMIPCLIRVKFELVMVVAAVVIVVPGQVEMASCPLHRQKCSDEQQ